MAGRSSRAPKPADIARSQAGISTLHDVTGGDPSRTRRWHENMRYGGDQELIAALRLATGAVWGAVGLYREPGARRFSDVELGFVRRVSVDLARGARRGLLYGYATDPDDADDPLLPGLVVVDRDGQVQSMTPGTERWLEGLRPERGDPARLPTAVRAVAASALRPTARTADGDAAVAQVPCTARGWVTLHGARLQRPDGRHAAVIIAPTHPSRIASLLMATYDLSDREQEVARRVLRGLPTTRIARELGISAHTVQEHLKHIFAKTGVHSRRTWSPRSSSPTTRRGCGTTNAGCPRHVPCSATRCPAARDPPSTGTVRAEVVSSADPGA